MDKNGQMNNNNVSINMHEVYLELEYVTCLVTDCTVLQVHNMVCYLLLCSSEGIMM